MSYLRFSFRLWRHEAARWIVWKIAYLLPRSVALIAFVRVYSTLESCGPEYVTACDNWDAGRGR